MEKKYKKKLFCIQNCVFLHHKQKHNTMKKITKEKLTKVIISVLNSPNKSAERAALWARLVNLRSTIN